MRSDKEFQKTQNRKWVISDIKYELAHHVSVTNKSKLDYELNDSRRGSKHIDKSHSVCEESSIEGVLYNIVEELQNITGNFGHCIYVIQIN